MRHCCASGSGGSVNNWPPRYGSVILKLDPNFGMGGITERRENINLRHCCASGSGGSVNNWPPRYGSVILKLDPNFGIGGITESREKMICGIVVHPDPVDPLIIGLLDTDL
jgi:hypothetical protein